MTNTKPDLTALLAATNRKEEQIVRLLSALSEELAGQLAEALERDRLAGGCGLPFEAIMAGLRPKLRRRGKAERKRVLTPQRAFFEIVDGLIANDDAGPKREGRIARTSLNPIWKWLLAQEGYALHEKAAALQPMLLAGDKAAAIDLLRAFDKAAGEAIRAGIKGFEAGDKAFKALPASLGGQRGYDDMRELGRVLQVAPEIRALRSALPPVIDDENDAQLAAIAKAYETALDRAPNAVPYLVLSLLPHVAHPWDLFGVAGRLIEADDDQDLKESELAMVGEWLVQDLESEATQFQDIAKPDFSPHVADDRLRRFAVLQAGMTRKVGMRKDGHWGKRLLKARGGISAGIEALFKVILQELKDSLPTEKAASGPKKGSSVPKTSEPPDEQMVERLEAIMQFLATTRLFAQQLGYMVAFEKTRNEVVPFVENHANAVVDVLRDAKRREREACLAWAEACARIMVPFCGEESVKVLCRRIAAAGTDQAASG